MTDSTPIPFRDSEHEPPGDPTTIKAINERFRKGSERMDRFEAALLDTNMLLDDNTELTRANTSMTKEMHEVWMFAKGGILTIAKVGRFIGRVGVWLRKAVMWTAPPVAAVVAGYHALKAWAHWGT